MSRGELRIDVLGPVRAWCGEHQLDLGPVRQQAMLAALVLSPDVPVSQQELLDRVWGLEPPGTGLKVVPGYIYRLRRCLGDDPVIASGRGGYRFDSTGVWVDTARLEELAAEAGSRRASGIAWWSAEARSRSPNWTDSCGWAGTPRRSRSCPL